MYATCPNDPTHARFVTTAHIQQEWTVDPEGNPVGEGFTLDVTHPPDPDNTWTCTVCGVEAAVER